MCRDQILCLLSYMAEFCSKHYDLLNAHTVDFIVNKKWEILPLALRKELEELDLLSFIKIMRASSDELLAYRQHLPHLIDIIQNAQNLLSEVESVLQSDVQCLNLGAENDKLYDQLYSLMSPKKVYEVQIMAAKISLLAEKHNIKTVIDVGSGRGYLTSCLAFSYKFNTLGIDSSQENTDSAIKRNTKVFTKVFRKTIDHHKENLKNSVNPIVLPVENPSKNMEYDHSTPVVKLSCKTHCIDMKTNFKGLLLDFISSLSLQDDVNNWNRILISGLHVCGDLLPTLLKHFVLTSEAKVLCCIGCCYQHVTERFSSEHRHNMDVERSEINGFPLSKELINRKYRLGRNARMLASQCMDRVLKNEMKQSKILFYRAVLQAILVDHCSEVSSGHRVGRLMDKCLNFQDYVEKSLKRLNITNIKLSPEQLNSYLEKYAEEEKKLTMFQLLRITISPCVENLILLDRLAYLYEQDKIEEAYISRIFDPVVSPRSYVLVAAKS